MERKDFNVSCSLPREYWGGRGREVACGLYRREMGAYIVIFSHGQEHIPPPTLPAYMKNPQKLNFFTLLANDCYKIPHIYVYHCLALSLGWSQTYVYSPSVLPTRLQCFVFCTRTPRAVLYPRASQSLNCFLCSGFYLLLIFSACLLWFLIFFFLTLGPEHN